MRQLSNRLIGGVAGVLGFATVATALTLVVEYKPYGVPDHRRAEYESKLDELGQRAQRLRELDRAAKPKVVVPESSHDFGMMNPHTTASHSFVIRNDGEHPLALEVRETSCKCTVGQLQQSLLPPAEQTTVTLTWNTGYQADTYEQTATVVTNDPLAKSIKLTVKGEVRAELIVPESVELPASDPAETTHTSFVVFSQLWDNFEVVDARCQLDGFQWHAEPIETTASELFDKGAKSAWRIRVLAASESFGKFEGKLDLTIQPNTGGEDVVRTLTCSGRVRAPIAFSSPNIHGEEGLDIGTLVAGTEQLFQLIVRCRGDVTRPVKVLDIKPDELNASLEPLTKPGSYRLTVKVPADCPFVVFNAEQGHGYVQVGDPRDPGFSNWFPLYGAVTTVEQ
jgi:hypothetical protein